MLAILMLSACNSTGIEDTGLIPKESQSMIPEKSPNMGVDDKTGEKSETTVFAVNQPALTLSIPKEWEDIAIIHTASDITKSAEEEGGILLFQLYEKIAYTTDEAMGSVWGLHAFTERAFKEKFGEVDPATVIGAQSYVIGSDSDYIYLLTEPTDVQFLENDDKSIEQYRQLQEESQTVLENFLRDNKLTANKKCPDSICYKVVVDKNK